MDRPDAPRPGTFSIAAAGSALCILLMTACSSGKGTAVSVPPTEAPSPEAKAAANSPMAAVNTSLQSGALDDAAAHLFNLRMSGRQFSESEAAEYRRALDETYSRALEAAEKGDARAQAALKILRATAR